MSLSFWKSGGESSTSYSLLRNRLCHLFQTNGTRYFTHRQTSSPSLLLFTDSQDPAIPRFRLGHGGYNRSTGELFYSRDVSYQLMIANKQEGYAFKRH